MTTLDEEDTMKDWPGPERREMLCRWLTDNGIDPGRVPVDSPFTFNAGQTILQYEEVVFDAAGRVVWDDHDRPVRVCKAVSITTQPPEGLWD